jgi:hypothetical protein
MAAENDLGVFPLEDELGERVFIHEFEDLLYLLEIHGAPFGFRVNIRSFLHNALMYATIVVFCGGIVKSDGKKIVNASNHRNNSPLQFPPSPKIPI